MTAIEAALTGLIDYAGLFPPASLDMRAAVRNYLAYREQNHAWVLGRFIVDAKRLEELRQAAGDALGLMRLSLLTPADADIRSISQHLRNGYPIEAVEIKCDEPLRIGRICEQLPPDLDCYCEIPVRACCTGAIDAIAAVGVRAKLRMGGVVPEAFPSPSAVADRLRVLADRDVPFKATAGLHHPLRSTHRLTYAADSPTGPMHGFMNVLCAAATVYFGGSEANAVRVLEDQSADAFQIDDDSIAVYGNTWTTEQLRKVRQFFTGFGSCSFTEPIHDLEALGWSLNRN
jgi:hypothetical protein